MNVVTPAPLGFGFKRKDENPLDCDLLVVDESSMVDVLLMQSLLKAVPSTAALLIVGDIDHPRQETRRAGWPEEGRGYRGEERVRASALVKAG